MIVHELFRNQGYQVFRYGMEHIIPGILDSIGNNRSEESIEIRRMPDFVIQNKESHKVHYVEVKYSSNESFSWENFKGNEPNPKAFVVVVSKNHIKCLTAKELKDGKSISPDRNNYLGDRPEFSLNKNVIVNYCKLAEKFFDPIK